MLAAAVSLVALGAQAADFRLMTGPQGGVWVPLGGQLKDLWGEGGSRRQRAVAPGAGIANVRAIEEGKAEIGFGNSISTVDGLAGNAPFPRPHTKVCNIASLYPQYFQMLVPANSGSRRSQTSRASRSPRSPAATPASSSPRSS
jgi:TRAP-type uncharacterized transport system substrate-binding protein